MFDNPLGGMLRGEGSGTKGEGMERAPKATTACAFARQRASSAALPHDSPDGRLLLDSTESKMPYGGACDSRMVASSPRPGHAPSMHPRSTSSIVAAGNRAG